MADPIRYIIDEIKGSTLIVRYTMGTAEIIMPVNWTGDGDVMAYIEACAPREALKRMLYPPTLDASLVRTGGVIAADPPAFVPPEPQAISPARPPGPGVASHDAEGNYVPPQEPATPPPAETSSP